jgi:Response regulator containing a CheY-like receiver domain and an HTH DNA-binding domain
MLDTDAEDPSERDRIEILHIDDSPEFVEMASTFLGKNSEEFEIETQTDPTEVPERLEKKDFDCVVSDRSMPDMEMDGVELHEKVREDHPDIPYIFFTGTSRSEFPDEAVDYDATIHMEKEIDPRRFADLATLIEEVSTE